MRLNIQSFANWDHPLNLLKPICYLNDINETLIDMYQLASFKFILQFSIFLLQFYSLFSISYILSLPAGKVNGAGQPHTIANLDNFFKDKNITRFFGLS